MHYRPDIDGLRAFAIAAVVLFHAGLGPFSGGFVGVDIFFVVSGYLITRLIVEQLRQGRFSFWDFYARRTRRIYPALFVLILAVLLIGYFVLTPGEYEDLGMSAVYSSAFLANVYFWLNTGYFDQSAEAMPLLHIWSIAVEEQFYLVWPLTLALLWRYVRLSRTATLVALVVATCLLLLFCVILTAYDPKTAFYLPFARLWEFTLGAGVLALPELRRGRLPDVLSVLGMIAMVYAVLAFNDRLAYPGYYAVLPCLGTAAAIAAGERSIMGRVLSLGPNVLLGKISYSLYLWHWPVIVYYALYAGTRDVSVAEKISLILIALALAYLSWRFVEQPIRHRRGHPRRHVAYGATLATSTAALALLVVLSGGFPERIPADIRALSSHKAMMAFKCTEEIALPGTTDTRCIVGVPWKAASKRAVIWGDSHARHLLPLLDVVGQDLDLSIAHWGGCPPFIDNKVLQRGRINSPEYSENCIKTRREFLDWIARAPDIDLVIISNAWATYPDKLLGNGVFEHSNPEKAMDHIRSGILQAVANIEPHDPILIIGDLPLPGFSVPDCALQSASGLWRKPCPKYREFFTNAPRQTEAIFSRMAAESNKIDFLDSLKAMCPAPQGCPIRVASEIIYRDSNHIRHDLSLETRQELVSRLGLEDALRLALHKTPPTERADAPGFKESAPRRP
jgi:peptidoglycan/LPS O-acetylase OafA/YrhL